jgi:hypothetical protein
VIAQVRSWKEVQPLPGFLGVPTLGIQLSSCEEALYPHGGAALGPACRAELRLSMSILPSEAIHCCDKCKEYFFISLLGSER